MHTVLIADRDAAFATVLAAQLSSHGLRSIVCPGPLPPRLRCIRCDVGYCPLTEGADAMVYEADLEGNDDAGQRYNLAQATLRAHPDVPMVLTWHTPRRPGMVTQLLPTGEHVQAAPPDATVVLHALQRLLASLPAPVASPI